MGITKHIINMGYSRFVFVGVEEDQKARGLKEEIKNSGFDINTNLFLSNDEQYDSDSYNLKEFIISNSNYEGTGIFTKNDIEALKGLHF